MQPGTGASGRRRRTLINPVSISPESTKHLDALGWRPPAVRHESAGAHGLSSTPSRSRYVADGAELVLEDDQVVIREGGDAEPMRVSLDVLELQTGKSWFAVLDPTKGYRRSFTSALFANGLETKEEASTAILTALRSRGEVEKRLNRHLLIGSRTHRIIRR